MATTPSYDAAVSAAVRAALQAAGTVRTDAVTALAGAPVSREDDPDVGVALRLGWAVAEARGRSWPDGPRPAASTEMPPVPLNLLPLRSQRADGASRTESVSTMVALARRLRLAGADGLAGELDGTRDDVDADAWTRLARTFKDTDAWIQDELAQRDDALANAYLLGRGLAESYWGLGAPGDWVREGERTGVSPAYLFGSERRLELTRMLGRLRSRDVHALSASAIDGSLQAWGAVAADPAWSGAAELPDRLYAQARAWYQLLVLGQDPTTLVRPNARLGGHFYFWRTLRAFWTQLLLATVAVVGTTVVLLVPGSSATLERLVATGGVGAVALAGVLVKAQSAAQRVVTRLRQDAYTDLVALSITVVPDRPSGGALTSLETLVRRRLLTPPTQPPSG
jgi:hypothetical protein